LRLRKLTWPQIGNPGLIGLLARLALNGCNVVDCNLAWGRLRTARHRVGGRWVPMIEATGLALVGVPKLACELRSG